MAVDKNCFVIGKIPGYNQNIDPKGHYQNILLRDITYIDMLPATYSLNPDLFSLDKDGKFNGFAVADMYKYKSGPSASTVTTDIFTSVLKQMGKYLLDRFNKALNANSGADGQDYSQLYPKEALSYMESQAKIVVENWQKTQTIRILAANDSTFTETISNTYSPKGTLEGISDTLLSKGPAALVNSAGLIQKAQTLSYDQALNTLTNFSSSGSLMDVLSGKLLGLQFSSPNAWQESSYAGTLSLFLKLAAPAGDPLSVLEHISLPILTMMGAGSPLTLNGLTYGMPLIWDVRAYGITRFKVGALAAITISRGSYETIFNADKQPLLVDVRVTIVPLVQDFAVQYQKEVVTSTKVQPKVTTASFQVSIKEIADRLSGIGGSSEKTETSAGGTSGVVPAKSETSISNDYFSAFTGLMNMLLGTLSNALGAKAAKPQDIYFSHGLGVQSPSDEIEGLMGLGADINSKRQTYYKKLPESHSYYI